ncbi:predicted protein [Nematostella vectensis]|uniref:GPI ethanolamine phosphate transferase 1 n=1 Tax=Nematostella vectensis TaxID=45351 RepID=A7RLF9_NEMVE|nr:predicted protein [Nematostella vectensis]|eukprot:XP_001639662.1 predicted protein [Nematostella vectensis]
MASEKAVSVILVVVFAGVLVHITYLASIFDIYFTSPLVHGMTPQKSSLDPPAKRLVLFVADGLRADKFFEQDENGLTRAPYLRHIIESQGCWGVSHTRVPTESRPGHVALIAGFYEDVSAVAKGWKENPVEFDSSFNETQFTWSWGSPDILPMFAKGATGDHVFTSMYPATEEDFADKDAAKLDSWVFDKVEEFFIEAKSNHSLFEKVSKGQIIFFLHLLGIDTNGHAHRPSSLEYLNNIAFVDKGIKKTVQLIDDFFGNDASTAFVLTSDHGMTNWGSHGAGHAHETLTPLVAWGAGIRGPITSDGTGSQDGLSSLWKLTHLQRNDVNQADIAPLMTSLIGVPYPLNSVGILPTAYLNNTPHYLAENLFTNAKQILAQYQVKETFRKDTSLIFRPFRALAGAQQLGMLRDIKSALRSKDYDQASQLSRHLMDLALEGLNYYQNYDRVFLNTTVTLGFVGWICCVILWIVQQHTDITKQATKSYQQISAFKKGKQHLLINTGCAGLGVLEILVLAYQTAPVMYYIYCMMPLFFWNHLAKQTDTITSIWRYICTNNLGKRLMATLIFGVLTIEILVLSFFHREVLCLGLGCFCIWVLLLTRACWSARLFWILSALGLAIFPLLPVVGREANYPLVILAGFLSIACFGMVLIYSCIVSPEFYQQAKKSARIIAIQTLAIAVAMYIVHSTSNSFKIKQGVPFANQTMSWIILFASFVFPLFSSKNLVLRLSSITLGFISVYLLMSTAYEGLFILTLSLQMSAWLVMEHKFQRQPGWNFLKEGLDTSLTRPLSLDDLRGSYFFVFFIITAFFGTGNIASINSFDPASVYCFMTVFSPFLMGTLLLCKVVVPFVIVTCAFDAVHLVRQVPVYSLFLVVLVLTDAMGLHFLYLVQDYGSWLEIGTSISHYVIMMAFIIFLLLIFGLSRLLTGASIGLEFRKKQV